MSRRRARRWSFSMIAIILVSLVTGCAERPARTGAAVSFAAGPGFGFSPGAALRDQDDAHLAGDLAAMVAARAGWIRLDIDWSIIEAEAGHYDWSAHDRLVEGARAAGLDVLAMVAYTPAWARPPDTTSKHPPIDNERFARFVADAVARYQVEGVRAWQVWNEPNSQLFWSTGPDPEGYGRLLAAAAAAVREVDQEATIVSGGLAPAEDRPEEGWLSPRTFLQRLIESGALVDIDAVGVHPYSFPARPLDPLTAEWNTFLALPGLQALLLETGPGPERIWITEYGAPTGDHERAVTEDHQAVLVTDALDAARWWPWLGPVFLYALRDYRHAPDELEWNYGIIRADGSPKEAWHRLVARPARRQDSQD